MSATQNPILGSIDAGGTTFKCAVARVGGGILASQRFQTTSPSETIEACVNFFKSQMAAGLSPMALGIAAFGPLDVDPNSQSFGSILKTPKVGWSDVHLKNAFEKELGLSVNINTDVNGALLAEMAWGAAQNCDSAAYVTIGTGIGAGIYANGTLLGKPSHPEFGHIGVKRHSEDDSYKGRCPFHSDCLEGLTSAPALTERFGNPKQLPADHIGWTIIGNYLAQACISLTLTARLQRIILGGGLMLAPHLIENVRRQYAELMGGYLGESPKSISELIVLPNLGDDAGLWGGIKLAASLST